MTFLNILKWKHCINQYTNRRQYLTTNLISYMNKWKITTDDKQEIIAIRKKDFILVLRWKIILFMASHPFKIELVYIHLLDWILCFQTYQPIRHVQKCGKLDFKTRNKYFYSWNLAAIWFATLCLFPWKKIMLFGICYISSL